MTSDKRYASSDEDTPLSQSKRRRVRSGGKKKTIESSDDTDYDLSLIHISEPTRH